MMKTPIIILILASFIMTCIIGPMPADAQDYYLPAPGVMVRLSPPQDPPILKGIKVHPNDPFRFEFILDKGDSGLSVETPLMASLLKQEATKLIKYFLASLTIPEKDLWVNLSPYEKDRIIPQSFGLTEMGRDLLAEDYMLKQITASLIYPEDAVGKKFWKRIYQEAAQKYGTTNIPVNTFNKVWIIPQKAVVYENAKAGTAYVVESKLKVMLEQDYLALSKNTVILNVAKDLKVPLDSSATPQNDVNALGSQVVREIVIPELTREVNENKNFARLRQVYNSLILATWYKQKIKDSILAQVYADKNKVAGVNIDDPQEKEKIYQQYLRAFKKGVYNYIKEDIDPLTQETIPRKYFSGGVDFEFHDLAMMGKTNLETDSAMKITNIFPALVGKSKLLMVAVNAVPANGMPTVTQLSVAAAAGLLAGLIAIIYLEKIRKAEDKNILKADFSKGIEGNLQQIEQVRNALLFGGTRSFVKVGKILSSSVPLIKLIGFNLFEGSTPEMDVYQHRNGLRIIRKSVEKGGLGGVQDGDIEAVKELGVAERHSIVPIFFSRKEPGFYYELDLRSYEPPHESLGFGYQTLDSLGADWLTAERRKKIISSINEGLRFDRDAWFDQQHFHGGNILIKTDEQKNITDVRIIDLTLLRKEQVKGNPVLEAIRDGVKHPQPLSDGQKKVIGVRLDWMDLTGFDLHELVRSVQSCKGSILNGTNLSGVAFEPNLPFSYSDMRGVILQGADLYDVKFSDDLDMEGAVLTGARLDGYYLTTTIGLVKNLDKVIMADGDPKGYARIARAEADRAQLTGKAYSDFLNEYPPIKRFFTNRGFNETTDGVLIKTLSNGRKVSLSLVRSDEPFLGEYAASQFNGDDVFTLNIAVFDSLYRKVRDAIFTKLGLTNRTTTAETLKVAMHEYAHMRLRTFLERNNPIDSFRFDIPSFLNEAFAGQYYRGSMTSAARHNWRQIKIAQRRMKPAANNVIFGKDYRQTNPELAKLIAQQDHLLTMSAYYHGMSAGGIHKALNLVGLGKIKSMFAGPQKSQTLHMLYDARQVARLASLGVWTKIGQSRPSNPRMVVLSWDTVINRYAAEPSNSQGFIKWLSNFLDCLNHEGIAYTFITEDARMNLENKLLAMGLDGRYVNEKISSVLENPGEAGSSRVDYWNLLKQIKGNLTKNQIIFFDDTGSHMREGESAEMVVFAASDTKNRKEFLLNSSTSPDYLISHVNELSGVELVNIFLNRLGQISGEQAGGDGADRGMISDLAMMDNSKYKADVGFISAAFQRWQQALPPWQSIIGFNRTDAAKTLAQAEYILHSSQSGQLTSYHQSIIAHMSIGQLESLLREYADRDKQYNLMGKYFDHHLLARIKAYEEKLRIEARRSLETLTNKQGPDKNWELIPTAVKEQEDLDRLEFPILRREFNRSTWIKRVGIAAIFLGALFDLRLYLRSPKDWGNELSPPPSMYKYVPAGAETNINYSTTGPNEWQPVVHREGISIHGNGESFRQQDSLVGNSPKIMEIKGPRLADGTLMINRVYDAVGGYDVMTEDKGIKLTGSKAYDPNNINNYTVTIHHLPVKKGELIDPWFLNNYMITNVSDNFSLSDDGLHLIANFDSPEGVVTYVLYPSPWQIFHPSGLTTRETQEIEALKNNPSFKDLMGKIQGQSPEVVEKEVNEFIKINYRYNRFYNFVLGKEMLADMIGDVLKKDGVVRGKCDLMAYLGYLAMRSQGYDCIFLEGTFVMNQDGDGKTVRSSGGHLQLAYKEKGSNTWKMWDPTPQATPEEGMSGVEIGLNEANHIWDHFENYQPSLQREAIQVIFYKGDRKKLWDAVSSNPDLKIIGLGASWGYHFNDPDNDSLALNLWRKECTSKAFSQQGKSWFLDEVQGNINSQISLPAIHAARFLLGEMSTDETFKSKIVSSVQELIGQGTLDDQSFKEAVEILLENEPAIILDQHETLSRIAGLPKDSLNLSEPAAELLIKDILKKPTVFGIFNVIHNGTETFQNMMLSIMMDGKDDTLVLFDLHNLSNVDANAPVVAGIVADNLDSFKALGLSIEGQYASDPSELYKWDAVELLARFSKSDPKVKQALDKVVANFAVATVVEQGGQTKKEELVFLSKDMVDKVLLDPENIKSGYIIKPAKAGEKGAVLELLSQEKRDAIRKDIEDIRNNSAVPAQVETTNSIEDLLYNGFIGSQQKSDKATMSKAEKKGDTTLYRGLRAKSLDAVIGFLEKGETPQHMADDTLSSKVPWIFQIAGNLSKNNLHAASRFDGARIYAFWSSFNKDYYVKNDQPRHFAVTAKAFAAQSKALFLDTLHRLTGYTIATRGMKIIHGSPQEVLAELAKIRENNPQATANMIYKASVQEDQIKWRSWRIGHYMIPSSQEIGLTNVQAKQISEVWLYVSGIKETGDVAMNKTGGIDLTPANMHLQTKNAGEGIKFHLDPAQLAKLQNAPGFTPVIINIQPMKDLPGFLGMNTTNNIPANS